LVHFGRALQN